MNFSFNLIDEPWVPCLQIDGTAVELGIRDTLLHAHELREIRGDTPLETAALHRLLLAILHRVFGPGEPTEWKQLWKQGQIAAVPLDEYLLDPDIVRHFDLFDRLTPFYQPRRVVPSENEGATTLRSEKRKGKQSLQDMLVRMSDSVASDVKKIPMTSFVLHAASGNNATLFDHNTEAMGLCLTPAQAARALLVSHLFGLGGTSSTSENFEDGPGAKGILFLGYGDDLFQTLMLNLVQYQEDSPLPAPNNDDRPAWEMNDPFLPNRSQPRGYLDYLTWHSRRVWLFPELVDNKVVVRQMVWVPGLSLADDVADPMKHYSVNTQGSQQPLCFSAERALWRDSSVLFEMSGTQKPPLVVRWLARLARPPQSILDTTRQHQLMALGMAKSKASLEFLRAETVPLHPTFLIDPDRVSILSQALQSAENAARALDRATFLLALLALYPVTEEGSFDTFEKLEARMAKGRNDKSQDRDAQHAHKLHESWGMERCFWSDLEPYFHRLIQDLPDQSERAVQDWRQEVRRAAQNAFTLAETYAGGDLRAQRAAALARQQFNIGLAAALGKASPPDNTDGGEKG